MKPTLNKAGFTLVEMLVVVSSLALLTLVGSNLFFASLFGSGKSEIIKEVRQNGEYALKMMEETIKNSYGISNCTENPATIEVKDKNNNRITYKFDSSVSRVASISSVSPLSPYYLTSGKVKVENFTVDCPADFNENLPSKISFSFKVTVGETGFTPERRASMTFSATVTSRNY